MQISITHNIKSEDIADLLCSALEGGSNYWYMIADKVEPITWGFFGGDKKEVKYLHLYPFNFGGALMIDDSRADSPELKKPRKLDIDAIKRGLEIMAEKYQKHFSDFTSGEYDGTTADVFLQCCIFEDVVYG